VPDFQLLRARVCEGADHEFSRAASVDSAVEVVVGVPHPIVLVATSGRVRVERSGAEVDEVASVRRGQALYVSAGDRLSITGDGEVFLATAGDDVL
jgi:mannose-6-phosphate isomerase